MILYRPLFQGLHTADIIAGYSIATKACLKHFDTLSVHKVDDYKNEVDVTAALRSAIAAKQYGLENVLAPLVARACIQILPKDPTTFNVDNVRCVKIPGMTVNDSYLMKGFVITRDSEGTVKHVNNARIVVFGTEVDLSSTETKGNVLIKNATDLINYSKTEEDAMAKAVSEIASVGVNVVVAQTTVHMPLCSSSSPPRNCASSSSNLDHIVVL